MSLHELPLVSWLTGVFLYELQADSNLVRPYMNSSQSFRYWHLLTITTFCQLVYWYELH